MTCSMLSASIAVAVPTKYIRKPGLRNAANEADVTGDVLAGVVAVDNQSPRKIRSTRRAAPQPTANAPSACALGGNVASQARAAGRDSRHGDPVVVSAASGNQLHQRVAQHVCERHGNIVLVRRG